ncbi:hypothetical protein CCACVL1_11767 [Corchorus capsularis]|uniref:Uncharacterized protein n=1 Tax=Corchorus capsularis TaxID=210143 RepID=A0A1R3IJJ4_COCAP|nr:hypothetical protein CCACVL1_11767 [Corchorus capsularis]
MVEKVVVPMQKRKGGEMGVVLWGRKCHVGTTVVSMAKTEKGA